MELTVDGKTVFAATGGRPFDAAKPAVIFLHGAAMDHTVWQLQTRYFAYHGYAVLALDLPGHGRSEGPPVTGIAEMAAWVGRVMTTAGLAGAALVGHSMGALVALATAAAEPERVTALALLGVATTMPVHPDLLAAATANDHRAFELITSWAFGRRAHLGGHSTPGLWMTGGGVRLLERSAPGVLANDLAACADFGDATEMAAAVRCPTLLLLGARDLMTPPKGAAALAKAIPGARMVVLPDSGHMMMIEQPDATLDALRDHIAAEQAA